MKKAKKVIAMIIILIGIAGFIPYPRVYKDGGTVELVALWYRYTRWHLLDNEVFAPYREDPSFSCYYKDGYWERTDFYLFPKNLDSHGFFEP